MTPARDQPRLRAALLLALVAAQAALTAAFVLARRLPRGHDGFQYYTLQYYFLAGAASGGVPRWLPFMTQGTVANWWFFIQAAPVQLVLLPFAALLRGRAFLPLFHLGIFFDRLVLLLGCWRLGRRYYASPWPACFAALTALGSTAWMTQPWWNMRLLYAVPLLLETGHLLLETGRWRWLLLGGGLMALQSFGNLPYFPPLVSMTVFLYFVFHAAAHPRRTREQARALAARWPRALLPALAIAGLLLLANAVLRHGTGALVQHEVGRGPDGRVTLPAFLAYGTGGPGAWLELLLGVSPALDYGLYFGCLGLACAALALAGRESRRRAAPVALTAAALLLFSLGTPVAEAAYYLWPMMNYFRHIGLAAPLARLFLCLLAGFGFEAAFVERSLPRAAAGVAAAALALLAAALLVLRARPAAIGRALSWMLARLPASPAALEPAFVFRTLALTAAAAAAAALLLALAALSRRAAAALTIAALLAQGADLSAHLLGLELASSVSLDAPQRDADRLTPPPYRPRRGDDGANPRAAAFRALLEPSPAEPAPLGTRYWSTDAYLFRDSPGSRFRVDHWLRPLDDLMRAASGLPLGDRAAPLPGWKPYARLDFPGGAAAAALAGVSRDKIRLFSRAYAAADEEQAAALIGAPAYRGDALVLVDRDGAAARAGARPLDAKRDAARDDRAAVPCRVERFDSNGLTVSVEPGPRPLWLSYADAWHEGWTARVDGAAVPVFKAGLAYKAVSLPPGAREVRFEFEEPWIPRAAAVFGAGALLLLAAVALLLYRELAPLA